MYSYYFPCDQASSFLARFFQDPYFKIRKKKINYGRKVIHCSLLSGYCYQQMVTNISWKEKRLQCHQGITWRETTKCQALLQWRKQKKQEQVSFPNTGHICLLHSLTSLLTAGPAVIDLPCFYPKTICIFSDLDYRICLCFIPAPLLLLPFSCVFLNGHEKLVGLSSSTFSSHLEIPSQFFVHEKKRMHYVTRNWNPSSIWKRITKQQLLANFLSRERAHRPPEKFKDQ